jgi:diacylglycerol kinase (ATP)
VIPLGTGTDFAATLDIPEDVDGAIEVLRRGRVRQVDLGSVNDRYFINVSAGGFIAEVSNAVTPELKSMAGKLAYLIGGAQVLFNFEPVTATVTTSSRVGDGTYRLLAFAACNARLIGGGQLIAPHAEIDDGALDICLIHAMPTLDFLGLLRRVSNGEHVTDDRVSYFRSGDARFVFDRTIKVNTDGQVLETTRCSYTVFPRAVRVIGGISAPDTSPVTGVGDAAP